MCTHYITMLGNETCRKASLYRCTLCNTGFRLRLALHRVEVWCLQPVKTIQYMCGMPIPGNNLLYTQDCSSTTEQVVWIHAYTHPPDIQKYHSQAHYTATWMNWIIHGIDNTWPEQIHVCISQNLHLFHDTDSLSTLTLIIDELCQSDPLVLSTLGCVGIGSSVTIHVSCDVTKCLVLVDICCNVGECPQ